MRRVSRGPRWGSLGSRATLLSCGTAGLARLAMPRARPFSPLCRDVFPVGTVGDLWA